MPGLITTNRINHVTTMVKDTAVAMEFYNNLLGIKQIESPGGQPRNHVAATGKRHHGASHRDPGSPRPSPTASITPSRWRTSRAPAPPWSRTVSRSSARACATTARPFLFIHDPDGNRVEFCTASGYAPAPARPTSC